MVKQEGSENSRMLMQREATEEKVELGMDKREENKMGRTQRPEEEKETWKVTAAQTQKRERVKDGQTIRECARLMEGKEEAVGLGIKLVSEIV